ncbi:MAG TPA: PDZ domain-containing protein [Candidatus Saccharicenans sp.]|nr:PDZ domain-containing protein [Candidatus Saccharicenans sp.]
MKKTSGRLILAVILFFILTGMRSVLPATSGNESTPAGKTVLTISMDNPASHCYQVTLSCQGLEGISCDYKMPVWSPGYYGLFDFAGNVRAFRAEDGNGQELKWEKTGSSTWRVITDQAESVILHYEVLATSQFVGQSYLGEDRGYVVPASVCMYTDELLHSPLIVKINLNPAWTTIATGLDPVSADQPQTFLAADFDELYDSPILMGNLESLPPVEIEGIPHYFIGYKLGNFNHQQFMNELKAVIEAGLSVIGEIPYRHYTFLGIGPGQGGIEHLDSAAVSFSGDGLDNKQRRIGTLAFLAHEYFHHFNVKRIRPLALGPFDYSQPNLTNMLWVSEGFTVYYEYLLLSRAGLMTGEEFLEAMSKIIASQENNPGRFFQSATESSYNTWTQGPFGARRGGLRKTISYYDKGAILGFLLDLNLRQVTRNRRSLDDVMKTLYFSFYKEKGRGFTDQEFRQVCEAVAGCPLPEIFEYASTTRAIDYPKYLAYAGLELEKPGELSGAYLGALVENVDGRLVVAAVEPDSPADRTGMIAGDEIKAVDGQQAKDLDFNQLISSRQPGQRVKISVLRGEKKLEIEPVLSHQLEKSFHLKPVSNPTRLQVEILNGLTKKQLPD